MFPKNSHIHLRASGDVSSNNCPSPIDRSNIPKWECILNFCSDFPGMNTPDLESSEKLDCLFPGSFHKIKFDIYQNIYKCSIHGLR